MNLKQYQEESKRSFADLADSNLNYLHMAAGILTETGELADIFKKKIAYGKEIDLVHVGEEIGDLCWFIANGLRISGIGLQDLAMEDAMGVDKAFEMVTTDADWLTFLISYKSFDVQEYFIGLQVLAKAYGLDFMNILEKNINKLKVRYPDKFDTEKALNRDLGAERIELEN